MGIFLVVLLCLFNAFTVVSVYLFSLEGNTPMVFFTVSIFTGILYLSVLTMYAHK